MTTLRLIADDLTGALDTAAELVALTGPVHVFWQGSNPAELPDNAALDLATREGPLEAARAATVGAVPALIPGGIAFKKIDSLMRGHTLPELAACFATGPWTHAVLAPAFPFQGRMTRNGRQYAAAGGGWVPAGPDLVSAMRALGVRAQLASGTGLLPGITVFDAETDADLAAVVAKAGGPGAPVLWCGTGGLARALAGGAASVVPHLPAPILGLFGSDQPVTAAQLAACHPHWLALPDATPASGKRLAAALNAHRIAAVSHVLPPDTPRAEAALRIETVFRALVDDLAAPGTLVVAGGETLRGLCIALGATSLEVQGSVMPGVPVSTLRGGRWDGVTVVSKSGAFGHPTLLRELLRIPNLSQTSTTPEPIGLGSALERTAS